MSLGICLGRTNLTLCRFAMVAASSMSAACLSSVFLGSFMCALVLGCHKYGLDPGERTSGGFSLRTGVDSVSLRGLRQHRSSDCVVFRRHHHTLSSYGSVVSLYQSPPDTFHSRYNHRRNIHRRNRLGHPRQQKSARKTPTSGRLVTTLRGYDHKQWHRCCIGSIRQPV